MDPVVEQFIRMYAAEADLPTPHDNRTLLREVAAAAEQAVEHIVRVEGQDSEGRRIWARVAMTPSRFADYQANCHQEIDIDDYGRVIEFGSG